MNTTKNKQIINGIIAGDNQILKSFYRTNLPIVQALITKYHGTTEDVEDTFQDGMILLYHQLRYKNLALDKASIHSYFIGICKNLWRSKHRKQRPLEHLELVENYTKDTTDSIDHILTRRDQNNLFYKHFQMLTTSNRRVLNLVFDGKSTKDIAQITGCSEGYTRKKRVLSKKNLMQRIFKDPLFLELHENSGHLIVH